MAGICITLGYALGIGAKSAHHEMKEKREKKDEGKRRREGVEVGSSGQIEPPKKKTQFSKRKLTLRRKSESFDKHENDCTIPPPDYDYRNPSEQEGNSSLGISNEGRACAEARADRDQRRAQRMADYDLSVAMVRARSNAMGYIPEIPEQVDPPPAYNPAEPRLPSYEPIPRSPEPSSSCSSNPNLSESEFSRT